MFNLLVNCQQKKLLMPNEMFKSWDSLLRVKAVSRLTIDAYFLIKIVLSLKF